MVLEKRIARDPTGLFEKEMSIESAILRDLRRNL